MARQHGRSPVGWAGAGDFEGLPQQRASRIGDLEFGAAGTACLAMPAEQQLVAEQERCALGQRRADDRGVPRARRHHDRLGQVLEPRPGRDVDRYPQHGLEPVRSGQRDRRGRRPHPEERSRANRDPQAELVSADWPGGPADQIHGLGRPP